MERRPFDLPERMFAFAVAVVKIVERLPRTTAGRNVANQLFRAGTSGPAKYEEACAGESRNDFLHKMQVTLKELREARFWLRLIVETRPAVAEAARPVLKEANELCRIIGRSVVTAKHESE